MSLRAIPTNRRRLRDGSLWLGHHHRSVSMMAETKRLTSPTDSERSSLRAAEQVGDLRLCQAILRSSRRCRVGRRAQAPAPLCMASTLTQRVQPDKRHGDAQVSQAEEVHLRDSQERQLASCFIQWLQRSQGFHRPNPLIGVASSVCQQEQARRPGSSVSSLAPIRSHLRRQASNSSSRSPNNLHLG